MYFDCQVVAIRVRGGNESSGFAHTKPDFQNSRRNAAECDVKIEWHAAIRNAIEREQVV